MERPRQTLCSFRNFDREDLQRFHGSEGRIARLTLLVRVDHGGNARCIASLRIDNCQ
jgi:hypothetical protein